MQKNKTIEYKDRMTGLIKEEPLPHSAFLNALYGDSCFLQWVSTFLRYPLCQLPFLSFLMGFWCNRSVSKRLIAPFIDRYQIDISEFTQDPSHYKNFNDFFTRHLKPEARPIDPGFNTAIIPADGRYLFKTIQKDATFNLKGQKLTLKQLLNSETIAEEYKDGIIVIGRLAPCDYHRFHFPFKCMPSSAKRIAGGWDSVHPLALQKRPKILLQNKRWLTWLQSAHFKKVAYIEIGALGVGSVIQTFKEGHLYSKGEEKGYFEMGGSTVVLLFAKDSIRLADDLPIDEETELLCLMGQKLGE